jgi:hypothetical protein
MELDLLKDKAMLVMVLLQIFISVISKEIAVLCLITQIIQSIGKLAQQLATYEQKQSMLITKEKIQQLQLDQMTVEC